MSKLESQNMRLEFQNVEDINISFNKDIYSYVINISYRHTDREGNVDIISIRDLPITINPYPIVNRNFSCYGCETSIDLGFGSLDFSEITSEETRRIHTVTKEITISFLYISSFNYIWRHEISRAFWMLEIRRKNE